ncbi:hypothetical protein A6A08_24045 [Nocardiopsis sp. TSRI0078]|uniref:DUF2470 domain-containing protein n=1 Tax=unclassified Nocardiopsis TaxID=2649073 RepID=UPI00093F79F5|nr:DUF2470 domain-containing protein [Nocardiopsis sp. TSRI0078]OKI19968.1 hypothetical protein A6A08_24045 [Nocardiopsis sp. TSRI0078]
MPSSAPLPSPADRARSLLARGNPATAASSARPPAAAPLRLAETVCHVHPGGEVSLLLPEGHPLLGTDGGAAPGDDPIVMVEFTDLAPVDLRDPVRAMLWISGTLTALETRAARERAVEVVRTDPDDRLLEIGHGAVMALLRPTLLVHSDPEGARLLHPQEFAAARTDPFSRWEASWLRHVDADHPELVEALAEHVPPHLRAGTPRPLGVDRFGVRLRMEGADGDHDIRLAFRRPARTAHDIAIGVHELAGRSPFGSDLP